MGPYSLRRRALPGPQGLAGGKGDEGERGIAGAAGANGINGASPAKHLFKGTTSGSGTYSVTYSTPFLATPNVHAQMIGGTTNQSIRITSSTTTGFTVTAYQINSISLLGSDILLATPATLNGAKIDVTVFE